MTNLRLTWLFALFCTFGLCPTWGRADVVPLVGVDSLVGLGSFEGSLTYAYSDAEHALLMLVLKNTSPIENGGYLTAFALNNPNGQITGASLLGPPNFALLGGPGFADAVNAAPFGQFDFGASAGGGFQGSGQPSRGLGAGATGSFQFPLTGTGLDQLGAASFLAETSAPPGDGQGQVAFVANFQGFEDDGSDTVLGQSPEPGVFLQETPEPTALALSSAALFALVGWGWARRKRAVPPIA